MVKMSYGLFISYRSASWFVHDSRDVYIAVFQIFYKLGLAGWDVPVAMAKTYYRFVYDLTSGWDVPVAGLKLITDMFMIFSVW